VEEFREIALIRANWRSVATCLAALASRNPGNQDKKLGTAAPIKIAPTASTMSSSRTVKPAKRFIATIKGIPMPQTKICRR
jgi:hypothetical protein